MITFDLYDPTLNFHFRNLPLSLLIEILMQVDLLDEVEVRISK